MEEYIEITLENSIPVLLPKFANSYIGKFVVRISKSLHQRLAIETEKKGVILNQLAKYKPAL